MILANSYVTLMISLGILFGLGTGALSFGLILTSAIHFVGPKNAMIISGMLNASAGMVGFILSPVLQSFLSYNGLYFALNVLILMMVLLVPIVIVVTSKDNNSIDDIGNENIEINRSLFREAFSNRTFCLLFAGFATCGFHMVIIESHLFSQFVLFGLNELDVSWAFSVYGIATIFGALLSGFLSVRINKGKLLGFYYGFRAIWVILYLWLFPKTMLTAVLFSIGLGMTGDATVSPTAGLVNENFLISNVAFVIGILFFAHQVGAFLSAMFGGVIRNAFGGYTLLWIFDILLCVFACVMSLKIKVDDNF